MGLGKWLRGPDPGVPDRDRTVEQIRVTGARAVRAAGRTTGTGDPWKRVTRAARDERRSR